MANEAVIKSSKLLAQRKLTIAFAESATAGRLAYEYSLTPDSGKVLKGGLVCYDAEIKKDILGIPNELLEKYTPESAEVTRELAHRLHRVIPTADIFVGITGLTTPGGSENPEKPVGTMFIHFLINGQDYHLREEFKGNAEQVVSATVERTALFLIEKLENMRIKASAQDAVDQNS